jgi:prepilin-type processing-associated H-X9-DG protein
MKVNSSNQKNGAMTAFEVLVVVAGLLMLMAFLLPWLARQKRSDRRSLCVNNLKEVNLAFRIWEGDSNLYPMVVSVTNGGGMELIQAGNLASFLPVVSNYYTTTKILVCPEDSARTPAPNWTALNRWHISYFFSADLSNEDNPDMVVDGDDNLIINRLPAGSGLVELSSNSPISWTGPRHGFSGNVGFADGRVMMEPSNGLQLALQKTGLATNRIVMP